MPMVTSSHLVSSYTIFHHTLMNGTKSVACRIGTVGYAKMQGYSSLANRRELGQRYLSDGVRMEYPQLVCCRPSCRSSAGQRINSHGRL